jgi:hypothetical protein
MMPAHTKIFLSNTSDSSALSRCQRDWGTRDRTRRFKDLSDSPHFGTQLVHIVAQAVNALIYAVGRGDCRSTDRQPDKIGNTSCAFGFRLAPQQLELAFGYAQANHPRPPAREFQWAVFHGGHIRSE